MRTAPLLLMSLFVCGPAVWGLAACSRGDSPKDERPRVAFITNCVDPFWDLARKGAEDAARELNVNLDYYAPPGGEIGEQKRKVEDLLARGVAGIAISPIDADNMAGLVDLACAQTHVVTHDSDAPGTKRRCFIGCDNYAAGRAAGALVKEALPDGGQVILFVGRLEQDNAKKRRQGVIDELLGRDHEPGRYDGNDGPLEGGGFTVLDTRTDEAKPAQAKANAEDALAVYPDLDAMVGLFAYNGPACLEAVKAAGMLSKVKIIAFDEARATVQAVLDGQMQGTISQQPYQYGYESVRILSALHGGDESVLPAGGVLRVRHMVYRQDNAQELLDLLDEVLGQ
jgi:ribose transport system substrate-binding protein